MFEEFTRIIKTCFPTKKEIVPLHEPIFYGNEEAYLLDTIKSTYVSSVGAYVDRVEEVMRNRIGSGHCVAVVNGTAALQVALKLAGVKRGDEVITQALTFVATANAIKYNNAEPVFVDVDIETMGLSPEALQEFLISNAELRDEGCFNRKTGRRIAACLPMHSFGMMCRIVELEAICNQWHISLVEDAAEALGSSIDSRMAGSFGDLAAFSFNGNKIVTSGGGGVIASKSPETGKLAKYLTSTAKIPHPYEYAHDQLGYNFRMPNLNAALLCAQLERLDEMIARKKALFQRYNELFENSEVMEFKHPPNGTEWNYWLMSVQLKNRVHRDLFLKESNEQGVMTRPIWQLMFRLPMYEHCQRDSQKNALFLEDRIVNIPSSANAHI